MYILKRVDTFNSCTISNHRTIPAAVAAQRRHARAVRRKNGGNSYIPTQIICSEGENIADEIMAAKMELDCQ